MASTHEVVAGIPALFFNQAFRNPFRFRSTLRVWLACDLLTPLRVSVESPPWCRTASTRVLLTQLQLLRVDEGAEPADGYSYALEPRRR